MEKVIKVKEITPGYVRVESEGGWAQLPTYIWNSMEEGGEVDPEYVFDSGWHRLYK